MNDECQEINEEGRLLNVELRYSIDFYENERRKHNYRNAVFGF